MKGKGGFTLIELLFVVIAMSILVSIAIPIYLGALEKARATEAIGQIAAITLDENSRVISSSTHTYADNLIALGYSANIWTPTAGALWNYQIKTDAANGANAAQPAIVATKAIDPSKDKIIVYQMGVWNAAAGVPENGNWRSDKGNHGGQP